MLAKQQLYASASDFVCLRCDVVAEPFFCGKFFEVKHTRGKDQDESDASDH